MLNEPIESIKIRRKTYSIERQGAWFYVVLYNKIGIPEVLCSYKTIEEAREFIQSAASKKRHSV